MKKTGDKAALKEYISQYYDIGFHIDDIRDSYKFDVTCQGSVPQAIVSFIDGKDFADVISNAISIGGDSDTIAAIAGSLAEVIYPIPNKIRGQVIDKLDSAIKNIIIDVVDYMIERKNKN